jgi:hypothetical protein
MIMNTVPEMEAVGTLSFHAALRQAEAQARSTLAPELHERISAARELITNGHCFQLGDGTWTVQSATDPMQTYTHVNGECSCDDVHYNKPPQGLCKHRIAVYLSRRALQLMQSPAPVVKASTNAPQQSAAADVSTTDTTPQTERYGDSHGALPLPEAPASVNCYITIAGRQVQITLRDADETRLLQRLAAVLALYPLPQSAVQAPSQPQGQLSPQQHNAAAMHKQVSDFCPVHHVAMKRHENAKGVWFSHFVDGAHCKGR